MPIHEHMNDYSELRRTVPVLRYGADRRNEMLLSMWREHWGGGPFRLLDLGTADGATLEWFRRYYPEGQYVGVDRQPKPLAVASRRGLPVLYGDARRLPFSSGEFDCLVLAATLKHIPQYQCTLSECRRVLKPGGYLLLLDPTPLGIRIGIMLGHFDRKYLPNIWGLKRTRHELSAAGYQVVKVERYVVSPVDVPGSRAAEAVLRRTGLDFLFLQQAIVARTALAPSIH